MACHVQEAFASVGQDQAETGPVGVGPLKILQLQKRQKRQGQDQDHREDVGQIGSG